jgi:hypothetical protein
VSGFLLNQVNSDWAKNADFSGDKIRFRGIEIDFPGRMLSKRREPLRSLRRLLIYHVEV